jgi:hypothetical protein
MKPAKAWERQQSQINTAQNITGKFNFDIDLITPNNIDSVGTTNVSRLPPIKKQSTTVPLKMNNTIENLNPMASLNPLEASNPILGTGASNNAFGDTANANSNLINNNLNQQQMGYGNTGLYGGGYGSGYGTGYGGYGSSLGGYGGSYGSSYGGYGGYGSSYGGYGGMGMGMGMYGGMNRGNGESFLDRTFMVVER